MCNNEDSWSNGLFYTHLAWDPGNLVILVIEQTPNITKLH